MLWVFWKGEVVSCHPLFSMHTRGLRRVHWVAVATSGFGYLNNGRGDIAVKENSFCTQFLFCVHVGRVGMDTYNWAEFSTNTFQPVEGLLGLLQWDVSHPRDQTVGKAFLYPTLNLSQSHIPECSPCASPTRLRGEEDQHNNHEGLPVHPHPRQAHPRPGLQPPAGQPAALWCSGQHHQANQVRPVNLTMPLKHGCILGTRWTYSGLFP